MTSVQVRSVEHEGRSFVIPAATVALHREDRLALAVATGNAFHYGGQRIAYSLEPGDVDLSLVRRPQGVPLLVDHLFMVSAFIGAATAATVEEGELRLLCRFARNDQADAIWSMLEQNFPLSVSVGGLIDHAEQAGEGMVRAVRWKVAEVSVCVAGRDHAASLRKLEVDEDTAAMVARMSVAEDPELGRRVALRRKLHLDAWSRWVDLAGPRLARATGADLDTMMDALGEEVSAHIHEIEEALT